MEFAICNDLYSKSNSLIIFGHLHFVETWPSSSNVLVEHPITAIVPFNIQSSVKDFFPLDFGTWMGFCSFKYKIISEVRL